MKMKKDGGRKERRLSYVYAGDRVDKQELFEEVDREREFSWLGLGRYFFGSDLIKLVLPSV